MPYMRERFIDGENPASHTLSVQGVDGLPGIHAFVQHDKTKTARLAGRPVANDLSRFHLKALGLHPLLQF
jgi:hypothetical protein